MPRNNKNIRKVKAWIILYPTQPVEDIDGSLEVFRTKTDAVGNCYWDIDGETAPIVKCEITYKLPKKKK